ncbi:MAG: hypothetical protein AAF641_08470 [Pseudomonadota bacterium]
MIMLTVSLNPADDTNAEGIAPVPGGFTPNPSPLMTVAKIASQAQ